MTKININNNYEYIDCDEKFLQLVEDYMGKDSVQYIENMFINLNCENCEKVINLEDKIEDLKDEIYDLNDNIEDLKIELENKND